MATSKNGGSKHSGMASITSPSQKPAISQEALMLTPSELSSLRRQVKQVAAQTRADLKKSGLIDDLRARMDAARAKG